MELFNITVPSDRVTLAGRKADVTFTVRNTGDREVNGRAYFPKLPPSAQAQAPDAWLAAVDPERRFAPGLSHQFVVRIIVPAGAAAGGYLFRLAVCEVERSDDEFTEGPAVAFEVPPVPIPDPWWWRWRWWVAGAATVVLLVVGLLVWRPWDGRPKAVTVPDVSSMRPTAADARGLLEKAGLRATLGGVPNATAGGAVGADVPDGARVVVWGQDPPAGQAVPPGSAVALTVWRARTFARGEAVDFDAEPAAAPATGPAAGPPPAGADLVMNPQGEYATFAPLEGTGLARVPVAGADPGGLVSTGFGYSFEGARNVARSGGKVVAVGLVSSWAAGQFPLVPRRAVALARYDLDGRLDATFGRAGRVTYDFGDPASIEDVADFVVQPDGKVVVAASVKTAGGNQDVALVRFDDRGTVDLAFGVRGEARTDFRSTADRACAVRLLPDNKILVAASSQHPTAFLNADTALARYDPRGGPDLTFGGGGGRMIVNSGSHFPSSAAGALAVYPTDGKFLVAGSVRKPNGTFLSDLAVARFLPNGTMDSNGGTSQPGRGVAEFAPGESAYASAVAVQPDGAVVAAGTSGPLINAQNRQWVVARFNTDLRLDSAFGLPLGYVTTSFEGAAGAAAAVAVQPADRKIVVAGTVTPLSSRGATDLRARWAVVRYQPSGSQDPAFGTGGKVVTPFGGVGTTAVGNMVLQDDRKVLVAGSAGDRFTLARYTENGGPDPDFGKPYPLAGVWAGRADADLSGSAVTDLPKGAHVYVRTDRGRLVLLRVDEPFDPAGGKMTVSYMTWTRPAP